ncbi:MAG: fluoride efflux transporter CrcB [Candidatus Thermoplasmatota archaeon]|nr:fluoride efflux transporter CrcB [Candidatus Thermoplasmatota archaeon]
MIQHAALVALGGALGALLRYALGLTLETSDFPWSTFMVNICGSIILGILSVMALNSLISETTMLFLGTGLLGAFTTMSTFSNETVNLVKNNEITLALSYATLSFILCIGGAFVGWSLGTKIG